MVVSNVFALLGQDCLSSLLHRTRMVPEVCSAWPRGRRETTKGTPPVGTASHGRRTDHAESSWPDAWPGTRGVLGSSHTRVSRGWYALTLRTYTARLPRTMDSVMGVVRVTGFARIHLRISQSIAHLIVLFNNIYRILWIKLSSIYVTLLLSYTWEHIWRKAWIITPSAQANITVFTKRMTTTALKYFRGGGGGGGFTQLHPTTNLDPPICILVTCWSYITW